MTADAVGAFLFVGCASVAQAQTPPPSTLPPPWAAALASCVPGTKLDVCTAALDSSKVHYQSEPYLPSTVKEIGFSLDGGRYVGIDIRAEKDADWQITRVGIGMNRKPGSERKELVSWFRDALKTAALGESRNGNAAANGCGASTSGPAWSTAADKDPEVELGLRKVPWLKPPHGKAMDAVFEKTKTDDDGVDICFLFPYDVKSPTLSPDVMRQFVVSQMFAGRTHPSK